MRVRGFPDELQAVGFGEGFAAGGAIGHR